MSHEEVVLRKGKDKKVHREVAETSVCTMLTNLCGYLLAVALVGKEIPQEYQLKTDGLGEGVLLSRKLFASTLVVEVKDVNFLLASNVMNIDDMAAYYSQDGGMELNSERGLVLKGNVNGKEKRSYNTHCPADKGLSNKFRGTKVRYTNLLTGGGALGKTCMQVLDLTDAEMPADKEPSGVIFMEVECMAPVRLQDIIF